MPVGSLLDRFRELGREAAVVWHGRAHSYEWLMQRIETRCHELESVGIGVGSVVALKTDTTPEAIALFLALAQRRAVVVPLSAVAGDATEMLLEMAEADWLFDLSDVGGGGVSATKLPFTPRHEHYRSLARAEHAGLVVFSSGSSGQRKAAVHDMERLLEKFEVRRPALRTAAFLLFDHLGGLNTVLHTLSNGGCLVTLEERYPDAVLTTVERHHVELLPTSPTFLNLMLLGGAHERHDLSSLKIISYGTEPMPAATLRRLNALLPRVRLLQTYGLSELGVLRSQSKGSDSLWIRIGGEGFETRVVDGVLHVRARSAMLGYLNATSAFTEDGWYVTGDVVDVEGDFVRFRGRASDVINVGGEKAFPAEIENVVRELDEIVGVVVYGEPNAIVGQIVCARVLLADRSDERAGVRRLREHCRQRLPDYMVPVRVEVVDHLEHDSRFKQVRPSRR